MVKRYFWLAHMLLVTLAAILTADIATSYLGNKFAMPVASRPIQTRTTPIRQTRTAFDTYQSVSTRNIFNANPPQEGAQPQPNTPPPEAIIKETELQLKLVGAAAGAISGIPLGRFRRRPRGFWMPGCPACPGKAGRSSGLRR